MFHRHADKTEHPDIVHAAADGLTASTADTETIQLEDIASLIDSILKETKSNLEHEHHSTGMVVSQKPASAVTVSQIMAIVEEASLQAHMTREEQNNYSADKIVDAISTETGLHGATIRILKSVVRFILRSTGKDNS